MKRRDLLRSSLYPFKSMGATTEPWPEPYNVKGSIIDRYKGSICRFFIEPFDDAFACGWKGYINGKKQGQYFRLVLEPKITRQEETALREIMKVMFRRTVDSILGENDAVTYKD